MTGHRSSPRRPTVPPGRGPRPSAPDPAQLAALLVRAWLEVRAGRRPLQQLAPLVAPAVLRRLAVQLPAPGSVEGRGGARLRRVHASYPVPGVCEAVVTVQGARRVTAVAVRLERHLGAWRAVELTAPEAGLQPLHTASLPEGWRPRDAFDEVLEEEFP